jgi:hypothetical protein
MKMFLIISCIQSLDFGQPGPSRERARARARARLFL